MYLARRRPYRLRPALVVCAFAYLCYNISKQVKEVNVSYLRRAFQWEDGDEFNQWYTSVTNLLTNSRLFLGYILCQLAVSFLPLTR